VCSSGRKTLTSPPEGFSVPTKATRSSGQNASSEANPRAGGGHQQRRCKQAASQAQPVRQKAEAERQ
jgi:hypothetical protein